MLSLKQFVMEQQTMHFTPRIIETRNDCNQLTGSVKLKISKHLLYVIYKYRLEGYFSIAR